MSLVCRQCNQIWEGNRERANLKINGKDVLVQIAERTQSCPKCGSTVVEELIEPSPFTQTIIHDWSQEIDF